MKILLLIDSLGSGGAQRQIVTLAEMLKEKHHDVSFINYYDQDFFKDKLDDLNIPIKLIPEKRPLLRIYKVRKFIRNGAYDVVISFLGTPNFLNCFSAMGGKYWKVITSERSSKESTFKTLKGRIYIWFYRYSDFIVCNSYNAKEIWSRNKPEYKDKLKVVYNPIKLPEITSEYIPKKNGKLNVVIAASYQYLKNPLGLIEALKLMSKKERQSIYINWYGRIEVVSGDTRAYDESIDKIKDNNLHDVIKLNSTTKDIANLMYEADIVALFSEVEGLPNAICEGMTIGKPVIMTKVSDYNVLVNEENGFLCDWDNPESIKDVLIKASNLSVSELILKGNNSRNRALELFSADKIQSMWLKLVD